jgi:hypothetical protein
MQMKTYIINLHLFYGNAAYAVCAMSESAAKQMLMADQQWDITGDTFEESDMTVVGECINFATAGGSLKEGEIVTLAWYQE